MPSKYGYNPFALEGCQRLCPWRSVLNSWAAETGDDACEVEHRAAVVNPDATAVGCAMRREDSCQMNVCVYDDRASETFAGSLLSTNAMTVCDKEACCGALTCTNSFC